METQTLFNSLSKTHLILAFVALMLLRVMVGFHFYSEGVSKLKTNGDWTAAPFLRAAKGPLAPMFQTILDDEDGRWRLCVTQPKDEKVLQAPGRLIPQLPKRSGLIFLTQLRSIIASTTKL